MKQWICMALALMLLLTGCAGSRQPEQPGMVFVHEGVEIGLNQPMAPVARALGEPRTCTEEPSCAFDGMEKTYYYGPFYIKTYPLERQECIYSIWFADDTVATTEGVHIGDSRESVIRAYGEACFNGDNAFRIHKGSTDLVVILKDDAVKSIQYVLSPPRG